MRIEDIDPQRCKPDYEAAILEDLAWLGVTWEEPVRRQSEHFAAYQGVLDSLAARGLLYPCFCTRKDIAEAGGAPQENTAPHYPGTCRIVPRHDGQERMQQEPYALRLNADEAWRCVAKNYPLVWFDRARGKQEVRRDQIDDVVLARTLRGVEKTPKVLPASYHLCVTHDDAAQGVTLVTRGEDLIDATPVHRLLQALMGWETPEYHHHRLLVDERGKRLAKRNNAPALREMRAQGISAQQIRDQLERLLSDSA